MTSLRIEVGSEESFNAFSSPKKRKTPVAQRIVLNPGTQQQLANASRHNPGADLVEPKVFSPHKTRKGCVPRRIEVERKKRLFSAIELTQELQHNGVIDHLHAIHQITTRDCVDSMSLSVFDNTDYESRSLQFWALLVAQSGNSGLPARAMCAKKNEESNEVITWENCRVVRGDAVFNQFTVEFREPAVELGVISKNAMTSQLERIFICFDAENPVDYCERLADAMKRQKSVASVVTLNLYVDCMPVDNLKPLDSEQVNRILGNAMNVDVLKQNASLDTSSLLQQFNLNHMRTLNQLILVHMIRKQIKEVRSANPFSTDISAFQDSSSIFSPRKVIEFVSDTSFEDRMKAFKFSSLWNKLEAISIMMQVQTDNYNLDKCVYFPHPEKTMRIEEFLMNHQSSTNLIGQTIKENWINAITASVRQNLKDVKKVN